MRRREAASERDSGREKAERSASSDHGRRLESERWTDSEKRERKRRKAGVATGAVGEAAGGVGFEMGRVDGVAAAEDIIAGNCKGFLGCDRNRRDSKTFKSVSVVSQSVADTLRVRTKERRWG